MAANKPVNMGLHLFPPPPKKAKNASKKTATSSQPQSDERGASPAFYDDGSRSAAEDRATSQRHTDSPITVPLTAAQIASIPRSHTSFSEAPTLVRSNSNGSSTTPNNSPPRGDRGEPIMRSIFPRYNPNIPLEHQPYYPTQASPIHIPRTIVNRSLYSPTLTERSTAGLQSPMTIGSPGGRFPIEIQDESFREPSSTEELKELWKVTNGWRVSASEGRVFYLKMASALEEPSHTLSSSTQTFYNIRLIPTSTSAQLTVTRQDPNRSKASSISPRLGTNLSSKPNIIEVMTTKLEEPSRRLPPHDGLVALLYPRAASNMAIELASKASRADGEQVIAAVERECGRLVWDEDSKRYYLVHPAMQTPFYISIHTTPAWSRSVYTLEHDELPRNLVRLSRDGSGSTGFLEIDTRVASQIDCFYIVDVAISAILLVALVDEKSRNIERFDAPPSIAPGSPMPSVSMSVSSPKLGGKRDKDRKKPQVKIEEFEMDLESQDSLKDMKRKRRKKEKDEKVPGFFGLIWMLIKCFVWVFVAFFKGIGKIISSLRKSS